MRPVKKGLPHLYVCGTDYELARDGLLARLGKYCSYCERRLATGWAVEHIQPKDVTLHPHLEKEWTNFLLACSNCNSCKGWKDPALDSWLIPDRDNTFTALRYLTDGIVEAVPGPNFARAELTITTLNLNKTLPEVFDEAAVLLALDRRTQRMDAWILAKRWRAKWERRPSEDNEDAITDLAKETGMFSIWLAAFHGVPAIWKRIIASYPGTEESCFDILGTTSTSPHPNSDGLQCGGKC